MIRPRLVLSKCFGFAVRYNGGIVQDEIIEKLKKFVDCEMFCPEVELGLGVPRPKIIIEFIGNQKRLYQPETGRDLTQKMNLWINETLKKIEGVDGFILKSKSPSCGLSSANYYREGKIVGRTDGFFAEAVKQDFGIIPVEHEGRLKNPDLRVHFLTRIFSFAEFRDLKKRVKADELVRFHTRHKYLLMTYNQKNLYTLGRIVADGKKSVKERLLEYESIFYSSFERRPSRLKHYNTILHIFGYFSDNLKPNEKKHFLELATKYKEGVIDLRIILEVLKSFSFRFENDYLLNQSYINLFPEELNQ